MRSLKQILGVAVLAAFLVVLPKGFTEPRDGWHLEGRVPAHTLALVSLEDRAGWEARFEKTAIAGLAREPEMKAFLEPITKAAEEMLESEEKSPFGEETALVKGALEQLAGLHGQVAVALLDVDMEQEKPQAVASLDFGKNVGDFAEFVERMRKQFDPDGATITTFQKDGRTWWQVQEGMPITATTVDTAFVLATDPTVLEAVIAGTGEATLGASADYVSVRARAGGADLALFAYANVPAIVDVVGAKMSEDERAMANSLGLDTVRAAAYGMAFRGDGFMDSFILHAPGADHGIVTVLEMPPFQPRALAHVPTNAFWYEEGSVNYAQLLPNVKRIAGKVDPDVVGKIDEWLLKTGDTVGVDIEKDLLGALAGGAAGYMAMPDTGGLYPELALMLQVSDPAGFEQTFQRFARGVAGAVTEEGAVIASTRDLEYRGRTLHLFEMQAARGRDVIPFTPTWTLLDDWLVVTLVPHAMKEIVLRGEVTTGGGLASQEDFRALQDVLPEGAGAMSYLDLQAVLNLLYDTVVPVLQTAVKPNVLGKDVPFPLDWAQLPAARTVRPYFRSLGIFTTWNKDGFSAQMHGPLPLVGVMLVGAAIAVPLFLRTMEDGMSREVRSVPGQPVPMPIRPEQPGRVRLAPQQQLARAKARELSSYVRAFLLTEKRLPTSLEELVTGNILPDLPNDPWNKAYELRVIEKKSHRFHVVSAGPDGKFDTADDVRVGQ